MPSISSPITKCFLLGLSLVCLALPSLALANAGDDQYCDPFTGCQSNKTKQSKKAPPRPSVEQTEKQTDTQTGLSNVPSSESTAVPQPDRTVHLEDQHKARMGRDIKAVLQAAGLDALANMYVYQVIPEER